MISVMGCKISYWCEMLPLHQLQQSWDSGLPSMVSIAPTGHVGAKHVPLFAGLLWQVGWAVDTGSLFSYDMTHVKNEWVSSPPELLPCGGCEHGNREVHTDTDMAVQCLSKLWFSIYGLLWGAWGYSEVVWKCSVVWGRGHGSVTSCSKLLPDVIIKQWAVPLATLGHRDSGSWASALYPGKWAVLAATDRWHM